MDHRSIDALIVSLATANGMVITSRQLNDAGIAAHLIDTRVGGILTRVSKGTFVVGELSARTRLRATLAALPAAAASHGTAASLHALPLPPPSEVSVLVRTRSRRRIDGVHLRVTRWLPADDVVTVDALRVTTVARTLCDLAAAQPLARTRHLVEHAITAELTTVMEFQACLSAYCRQGRAGSGLIRRVDHDLLDSQPVPASALEVRAAALFRRAGLHGWVPQYAPPWYDGVRGVVDLAWPHLQIVVELDGRRWHAITQAHDDDRRRDRSAVAHGWLSLRFGWQEIMHRPAGVIDECRAVFAARRAALSDGRRVVGLR
jgi:predicted transcriptional regulator of viral defense system